MSEFRNREKRQALLFIALGLVISIFSYQNFQFPQTIHKSNVDLATDLHSSDAEILKTRQRLSVSPPIGVRPFSKTQVVESEAPMKLKLKRAPAAKKKKKKKSSQKSSKKKKKKGLTKIKGRR